MDGQQTRKVLSGNKRRADAVHIKNRTAKPRPTLSPRTCLACGAVFSSTGPGNRICGKHGSDGCAIRVMADVRRR